MSLGYRKLGSERVSPYVHHSDTVLKLKTALQQHCKRMTKSVQNRQLLYCLLLYLLIIHYAKFNVDLQFS